MLRGEGNAVVAQLYTQYGAMLFGYILKFVPEQKDAEQILIMLFSKLGHQLEEAFTTSLNVYCWLQLKTRELILKYSHINTDTTTITECVLLLDDAPQAAKTAFVEIYLQGRSRASVAAMLDTTEDNVTGLLFSALSIIRKKLL